MIIKSRALAAYIEIESNTKATVHSEGFDFDLDESGCVGGKRMWQWERDFNDSQLARFNQRLRTLGDAQRELRNNSIGN